MKMVVYNSLGTYYVTTKENYYAFIRNANKVNKMNGFKSPEEIIEYYCHYFGSKPEDFEII